MASALDADVLVIGGGGAGARAALAAAEAGARVVMVLKGRAGRSGATTYRVSAIGGFQAATGQADSEDSPEIHVRDIVDAAQGMCDERLARVIASEAPLLLDDLLARGVEIVKENGQPVVSVGCFASRARMYWIRGHGHAIVAALKPAIQKHGVRLMERATATSLLIRNGACIGATVLDEHGSLIALRAKATILCTGGAARLFARNLNPPDVTGDGYALAFRAGAELMNLEFIQCGFGLIHPVVHLLSALVWRLVPEMRNGVGGSFLPRYLPSGLTVEDCAGLRSGHFPFSSRNVDRYIDIAAHTELCEGRGTARGGIVLDFSSDAPARIAALPRPNRLRWEYLRQKLAGHGVDPQKDPLEVSLYAQAFNGGVRIDEWGRSTVEGLYAAGEVAGGPHGADRLGGNMLMTSQVFGQRAGRDAARRAQAVDLPPLDHDSVALEERRLEALRRREGRPTLHKLLARLQAAMWRVLVVRDEKSLRACLEEIGEIEEALSATRVAGHDDVRRAVALHNLLLVGKLFVFAALLRRESRGSHYRADYPTTDDEGWRQCSVWCRNGEGIAHRMVAF